MKLDTEGFNICQIKPIRYPKTSRYFLTGPIFYNCFTGEGEDERGVSNPIALCAYKYKTLC